jgi:hypothetical protein
LLQKARHAKRDPSESKTGTTQKVKQGALNGQSPANLFNLENSMTALQAYINQKNKWNAIFKGEQFELETAQGRQRVAESLDADLSPENLTCDGELSRAEINRRHKVLTAAATELARVDPVAAQAIYELYTGE